MYESWGLSLEREFIINELNSKMDKKQIVSLNALFFKINLLYEQFNFLVRGYTFLIFSSKS